MPKTNMIELLIAEENTSIVNENSFKRVNENQEKEGKYKPRKNRSNNDENNEEKENMYVNKIIKATVKTHFDQPKKRFGFLSHPAFSNNIFFYHHDFVKAVCKFEDVKVGDEVFAAIVREKHGKDQNEKIFARCISKSEHKTSQAFTHYQKNQLARNSLTSSAQSSRPDTPDSQDEEEVILFNVKPPPIVQAVLPNMTQIQAYEILGATSTIKPISKVLVAQKLVGNILSVNQARQKAQVQDVVTKKEYHITPSDCSPRLPFTSLVQGMKVEFEVEDGYAINIVKSTILSKEECKSYDNRFFVLGEAVELMESRTVEFKSFTNDVLPNEHSTNNKFPFPKVVEQYTCGFLNSNVGGSLFFGINDNGIVCGTTIGELGERKQLDSIKLHITSIMRGMDPSVDGNLYECVAHSIYERMYDGYVKSNTKWVIELIIHPYNGDHLFVTSGKYENDRKAVAYHRHDGSTIAMDARTAFHKGLQRARILNADFTAK
jgi:hypothetical protein